MSLSKAKLRVQLWLLTRCVCVQAMLSCGRRGVAVSKDGQSQAVVQLTTCGMHLYIRGDTDLSDTVSR